MSDSGELETLEAGIAEGIADGDRDEPTTNTTSQESELRLIKAGVKGEFTKARRSLLVNINAGVEAEDLLQDLETLTSRFSEAMSVISDLVDIANPQARSKLVTELETLEEQYGKAMDRAQSAIDSSSGAEFQTQPSHWASSGQQVQPQWTPSRYSDWTERQKEVVQGTSELSPAINATPVVTALDHKSTPAASTTSSSSSMIDAVSSASSASVTASTAITSNAAAPMSVSSATTGTSSTATTSTLPAPCSSSSSSVASAVSVGTSSSSSIPLVGSISSTASTRVSTQYQRYMPQPMQAQAQPWSQHAPPAPYLQPAQLYTPVQQYPLPAQQYAPQSAQPPPPQPYQSPYANAPPGPGAQPWQQLKRIGIPVFKGEKRKYEAWKSAFIACIDSAPASAEYKLLQLKQYLHGEPLDTVDSLGYSAAAYEAAKKMLDFKYGGTRRKIALHVEELEQLPSVGRKAKDMEKFSELLAIAIVNLRDNGRTAELQPGTFYNKLLRKFDEPTLTQYHRWRHEHGKAESVECLEEWAKLETSFLIMSAETVRGISSSSAPSNALERRHTAQKQQQSSGRSFHASRAESGNRPQCTFCNSSHEVRDCASFKQLTVQQRWSAAKERKLCYRCLGSGHAGKDCRRDRVCKLNGCTYRHHRLLHKDLGQQRSAATFASQPDTATGSGNSGSPSVSSTSNGTHLDRAAPPTEGEQAQVSTPSARSHLAGTVHGKKPEAIALRTIPVVVKANGKQATVNAMLDDGSTQTYINNDIADLLNLKGETCDVSVTVLNGRVESFKTTPVVFELESLTGETTTRMYAETLDRVAGDLKPFSWRKRKRKWQHLAGIEFPKLGERPVVDLLIGLDYGDLHRSLQDVHGEPGEPIARRTPLGWTCVGTTDSTAATARSFFIHPANQQLDEQLQRFWQEENIGSTSSTDPPPLTSDDAAALEVVRESLAFDGSSYKVALPWKPDRTALPNNYAQAERRLQNTERRLLRDSNIAAAYSNTINSYLDKGYVRKVPSGERLLSGQWLLPHFAVLRPEKSTTKTRVVFDAAARFSGTSLNDHLFPGPKLQRSLVNVLLRFRRHPVAIACDVAEMYLRIKLAEEDRSYVRFLWRDLDQTRPPEVFEFQRVVFGVNSSPFLAQFVTQEHARKNAATYPRAAEAVTDSTYMDDTLDSVQTAEDGIQLYQDLSALWSSAGMYARKWLSNSPEVLQVIPEEARAKEIDLDSGELPSVKVLGMLWTADKDLFTFRVSQSDDTPVTTKREALQRLSKLFDPLGIVAPVVMGGRILLQRIWLAGTDWDDAMPGELADLFSAWLGGLDQLCSVEVPRCLSTSGTIVTSQLHVFTDASQDAYGAVVYCRHEYTDGAVSVRLVAARVRVAPLKSISIPRLELMGAVIGAQLVTTVAAALEMPSVSITLWSDSLNVLFWIKNRSRSFKPFIANRVGELQRLTLPSQWRHVPGTENPADLVSRGVSATVLLESELWWSGPMFLRSEASAWPARRISIPVPEQSELKQSADSILPAQVFLTQPQSTQKSAEWALDPQRFSQWLVLLRRMALVLRFVENCRQPATSRQTAALTADELADAERLIIQQAQVAAFPVEYELVKKGKAVQASSKLAGLNAFIDDIGQMRVGGRLQHAAFLSYDAQHPVILPRTGEVTRLIVRHYHEQGNHTSGVNHVMTRIQERFWIIAGREAIREVEAACNVCKRRKAKPATQIMAPLPKVRLEEPLKAFARVSVDYAGPFETKQGRGQRRAKRYLCVFTCCTSRAVHLEMATALSTDAFLNAFERFCSRRGVPTHVTSDNGTNFVGAERELAELAAQLDIDKVSCHAANHGIQWSFNPPLGPHFGGLHESMVKSAKRALFAVLQKADVTDEELQTAFVGAEGLLNSRPLSYVSTDHRDDIPLTPNHFLFGMAGGVFAPAVDVTEFSLTRRWRYVQNLIKHCWQRWMKELIPALNSRPQWRKEQRNISKGDIVTVVATDSSRGQWPIGRIEEVMPGKDGHVRVVRVRVGTKVYTRPITRVCPLINAEGL